MIMLEGYNEGFLLVRDVEYIPHLRGTSLRQDVSGIEYICSTIRDEREYISMDYWARVQVSFSLADQQVVLV